MKVTDVIARYAIERVELLVMLENAQKRIQELEAAQKDSPDKAEE